MFNNMYQVPIRLNWYKLIFVLDTYIFTDYIYNIYTLKLTLNCIPLLYYLYKL